MARSLLLLCLLIYGCNPTFCILLVIPEDVPAGFAAIFGFSPLIRLVNDNRVGFGFRLGNHADLQVQYELGPQQYTKPLQPIKIRSATYRERTIRRRPFLNFLLNLGVLKESSYELNFANDSRNDEPR